MNILVTGANGQLGHEMQRVAKSSNHNYIFTDVADGYEKLDITNIEDIRNMVKNNNVDIIVNCAAYTNVDKAESDYDTADLINNTAAGNLATAMKEAGGTLIHISTDYVFQGDATRHAKKTGRPIRSASTAKRSLQARQQLPLRDVTVSSYEQHGSTRNGERTL